MSRTMSVDGISSATGGLRHYDRAREVDRRSVQLKWIDAFETGNAEIDADHRKLFQDCNSLLLLVENEADRPLILAEAKRLVQNCIAHFRLEESLLENTRFGRCAEHEAQHRLFERELQGLIGRMEQLDGSLKEHRDIPRSFGPSLIDFIIRHDLDFRSHLLHQRGR